MQHNKKIRMAKNKSQLFNNLTHSSSNIAITVNVNNTKEKETLSNGNEKADFNNLVELYNNKKFDKLLEEAVKFIKKYPNNFDGLNSLALAYKNLRNYSKAIEIYEDILSHNPSKDFFYQNAANAYFDIGDHDKSEKLHNKALELNPKNIWSLNSLGLIYSNKGDDVNAINFYLKSLKINQDDSQTHYNLATSYRKIEQFSNAASHYRKSTNVKSKDFLLECLYLDPKASHEEFYSLLDDLKDSDRLWPLTASISAHASRRFSKNDPYPFCKKPKDFIQKYNLNDENLLNDDLITRFLDDVIRSNITKRGQSLLKNGEQTSGNLFNLDYDSVREIKKIVENKIEIYRMHFSKKEDGFIKNWPNKYNIYAWLIFMNKSGNLSSHIHKEGWLSSSIYLKMPNELKGNEGAIQFSLDGANYPNNENITFSKETCLLKKGDMVMFPSSLFHSTVPFSSEEQRITLAFDIIPE